MRGCRSRARLPLTLLIGLGGCSSLFGLPDVPPPPAPVQTSAPAAIGTALTAPLFVLDAQDAELFRTLAEQQDRLLVHCAEHHACDRAHYLRGLVALCENRVVATRHFEGVLAVASKGPLAASSRYWLQLLRETRPELGREKTSMVVIERLVREILERELAIQRLKLETEQKGASVRSLKQSLKARDERVEDLTGQLEALKRIDQEMKERTRSLGASSPIEPLSNHAPRP
ncbi:MAG: hypothetical protein ACREIS_11970 [Nitrospiraceae bacterium]